MAIFLTQYDVTLSDGSRKTFAADDIEADSLQEAQEIACLLYTSPSPRDS